MGQKTQDMVDRVYVKEQVVFLFVGFCPDVGDMLHLYCCPCCVWCAFRWENTTSVSLTFSHYHAH